MIKALDITKIFRSGDIETAALRNVNLEIREGEFVAVTGPSGCGKSTLLNLLGLLDTPTSGNLILFGKSLTGASENTLTKLRKGNIGFIFQSFNLIDELNVYENVELPLVYLKIPLRERKNRIENILERMQIAHRKSFFPQQLSGGQQQRVAVARAVVTNPKIILADEPTGNLDSENRNEVMAVLKKLNESGTTIVMATHSTQDADRAHRVIQLFDGSIVTENIKIRIKNSDF